MDIQGMINAACYAGGGEVVIPDGINSTSAGIAAPSGCRNVTIRGKSTAAMISYVGTGINPILGLRSTSHMRIENLTITGNGNSTVALEDMHGSENLFENMNLRNVSGAALHVSGGVNEDFKDVSTNSNERAFIVVPVNAVLVDAAYGWGCYYCHFEALVSTGVSGAGWSFSSSFGTNVLSSTSEGNGAGLDIGAGCDFMKFQGVDFEANHNYDAKVAGNRITFENVTGFSGTGRVFEIVSGIGHRIIGGSYNDALQFDSGAHYTIVDGAQIAGTWNNLSVGLVRLNQQGQAR